VEVQLVPDSPASPASPNSPDFLLYFPDLFVLTLSPHANHKSCLLLLLFDHKIWTTGWWVTRPTSRRNRRTSDLSRLFTSRLFTTLMITSRLLTDQLHLLAAIHPTDILLTLTVRLVQGEMSSSPTQSISLVGQPGLCLVVAQASVSLTSADGTVTLSTRLVTPPVVFNIQTTVCFELLHWSLVGQSQKHLMQCTP
jgi:hypothetical protein